MVSLPGRWHKMQSEDARLLMSMTETEAAALEFLAALEQTRADLRRRVDGERDGGRAWVSLDAGGSST